MKIFQVCVVLLGAAFSFTALAQNPPPSPIKGTVVDVDGRPVPEATVQQYRYDMTRAAIGRVEMEGGPKVTTSATGQFEFAAPATVQGTGPALLIARKTGLAPGWLQMGYPNQGDAKITLAKGAPMAGTVVDETDKPLPNVEVFVAVAFGELQQGPMRRSFNYLSDKAARELFNTKSGPDGHFRIEGFPTNASASLSAEVPGKSLRSSGQQYFGPDSMPHRPGQLDIKLVMETTGGLEGKVVAEDPSQKLPEANIFLQPQGPVFSVRKPSDQDKTRPDGTFVLKDVAPGTYSVRAIFGTNALSEWVAEMAAVTIEAGSVKKDVQLTASHGGLLEVVVRSKSDHKPIENVNINVFRQEYQSGAMSSSNGIAQLRAPAGEYQVNTYKEGWRPDNTSASVEAGKTNRIEMELTPPLKLRAIVRRPDGQPATNLVVRIIGDFGMEDPNMKTGPDGKFEMDWNSQRPQGDGMVSCLLVRDPENNLAVAQDIDDDNAGKMELKLEPGITIAGSVQSEGKPLTNAVPALVFWSGNSGMHLNNLASPGKTPGSFEINALPPGRRYGLYVSAPGYSQKYVNFGDGEQEAKRIEVDTVELRVAKLKLAGKVVDTDDKPVAGVYVHMSGDDQPNGNTRTGPDGRFSFDSVCEGPVRLFANNNTGSHGNISAEGGDTNVVLKLGETFAMGPNVKPLKVNGLVTGPDGKPVAGAQLEVLPGRSTRQVKTQADGTYNLTWNMEPWQRQMGNAILIVRDLAHNLAAAQELAEDSTNLNVQLKPGLTIEGKVQKADGTPLRNAQVGLWMQTGRMTSQFGQQIPTDASGSFTMAALPTEQDFTVFANAKGFGQKQLKVEVDWNTNHVTLEPLVLRLADQVISGQVVNAAEKPVSSVHVSISGDGQPQTSSTTDSKGRFNFKVCEGQVQVFASGQIGWANSTVEAGDTNVVLQLSQNDRGGRRAAKKVELKGKSLPDLTALGLTTEAVPAGKPVLLCLMDVQQRPSRRMARLLTEQQDALKAKGINVVAIQAVASSPEVVEEWKESNPVLFPIGRLSEKGSKPGWIAGIESFPWLILTDSQGKVTAEGFAIEDLEARIEELPK